MPASFFGRDSCGGVWQTWLLALFMLAIPAAGQEQKADAEAQALKAYLAANREDASSMYVVGVEAEVVDKLQADDPRTRLRTQRFLWRRGADAQLAAAIDFALRKGLCDAHLEWLAGKIDVSQSYATAVIPRLLSHESPRVRVAAMAAIVRVPGNRRAIRNRLLERVLNTAPTTGEHVAAARLLGECGVDAEPTLPALLRVLRKDRYEARVQLAAVQAIRRIRPKDEELMKALDQAQLDFQDKQSTARAAEIAGELQVIQEELDKLREDTKKAIRQALLDALIER